MAIHETVCMCTINYVHLQLLLDVTSSPRSHQVRVVYGSRDTDRAWAASIHVTQLVGHDLQFVSREIRIVPQHVISSRSRSSLQKTIPLWSDISKGGGHVSPDSLLPPNIRVYIKNTKNDMSI